jgi:hypothetical protein
MPTDMRETLMVFLPGSHAGRAEKSGAVLKPWQPIGEMWECPAPELAKKLP